jgi:NAD(P)H-nitrite reductase large subunit
LKYVIIGNSTAAIGCIEGIRRIDTKGEITLVTDEKHHTYSRPLISYWLWGKVEDKNMYYRAPDFYHKNNVTTMFEVKATAIDPNAKKVALSNGESLTYDKLMVATGSSPMLPPVAGLKDINFFTFQTWDSAIELKEAITPECRVVILGAGLIGLKCAEAIAGKVASLIVIDLANRVLPSVLDEGASAMVQAKIEENGVQFILSNPATNVTQSDITLKDGTVVPYDILVVAAGVIPNTSLIKDAGGEVIRGIITNEQGQTSLPDVYSAGDCVQSIDVTTGQSKILALLPNAYMQGETAGITMAGGEATFDKAIAMNAVGFFGMPVVTAGTYSGDAIEEISKDTYRRLFIQDNYLIGFILIGAVDRSGIYTALIRNRVPLNNVDFDILKNRPQLMMFGKENRKRILSGGEVR